MSESRPNVGGQAVLEGVMMRSPRCFAVAVRRKAGTIVIREQPWEAAWTSRAAKIPFVRGVFTLFESLHNGYSALQFSAQQMEQDLPADESAAATEVDAREVPASADTNASNDSGVGTRIATVLAIGLFIALPQLLAWAVSRFTGGHLATNGYGFQVLTGAFKLAIVVGYLLLIRRVPDVRRVFQYHGAEHKAIATYEAGETLTVENARKHSTRHARCGTTFLLVVVFVSVLAYIGVVAPLLHGYSGLTWQLLAIAIKIPLLIPVAAVAYELQRLGARFADNPVAKIFLTPGYWVQGITTIEPTDDQLEIALASLRVTLLREAAEARGEAARPQGTVIQTYPSYVAFATEWGGLSFSAATVSA